MIRRMAFGEIKGDKATLTANIALTNAFEPGFKGIQRTEGHVNHNIRVLTNIPRPNYDEIEKPKAKLLTEDVTEGVVIPEKKPVPENS